MGGGGGGVHVVEWVRAHVCVCVYLVEEEERG